MADVRRPGRLLAACGIVGPAAFTLAWVAATRREPAYSAANEHISGLAAADAASPRLMTAGFLTLGVCTVAFCSELHRRLGGDASAGVGPALLGTSGLAIVAAGVLRRDRRSNWPEPGIPVERQSWVNDAHDLASVAGQVSAVTGLVALAARCRHDPALRDLAAPAVGAAAASSGLMAYFARDVVRPGNGVVQRIAVSVPLAFMAWCAARLLRGDRRGGRVTPPT
jgi:hypothetical protein